MNTLKDYEWGRTTVADKKQVNDFAEKWIGKFKNDQTNYLELVDHFMADDCRALGFEMDCGHAFEERYGTAVYDNKALEHIIADVADIPLLGSAIYSRWRYFNHWAYSGAEIMEQENRAWFITALDRLTELASNDNSVNSIGAVHRIKLISNCLGYGPCLKETDLVEQHLTLCKDGRMWLSFFEFGIQSKYRCVKREYFNIDAQRATSILTNIADFFRNEYLVDMVTDTGDWDLMIEDEDGKKHRFQGPLVPSECNRFLTKQSNILREAMDRPDAFAFDGAYGA